MPSPLVESNHFCDSERFHTDIRAKEIEVLLLNLNWEEQQLWKIPECQKQKRREVENFQDADGHDDEEVARAKRRMKFLEFIVHSMERRSHNIEDGEKCVM